MRNPPLVSVVIPFYNTAAYLAEAVESVLGQTHQRLEVVLNDNCSDDGSSAIAQRFVDCDTRVRLVRNQRFLSQVQNYNQALARMSPEARYCKMVQADDAIFPRCLEEMVAIAESTPSIGIVSSCRLVGSDVMPKTLPQYKTVMTGREAARIQLIDDISMFGSPTTNMIRADLVRARVPFYAEGRYFEDIDVIYEILQTEDFGFAPEILTFARRDEGSIWGKMRGYFPSDLARLVQLKVYGLHFMEPDEFQRVYGAHERDYRRMLAVAWLQGREASFWEYHSKGLAAIGAVIDRRQLVKDAAMLAGHHMLARTSDITSFLRRTFARVTNRE